MSKYSAVVSFIVQVFDARDENDAREQINNLVDQLATVDTLLTWDDVDWDLIKENEEDNNE